MEDLTTAVKNEIILYLKEVSPGKENIEEEAEKILEYFQKKGIDLQAILDKGKEKREGKGER